MALGSTGHTWVALWAILAALVACCAAGPVLQSRTPNQVTALPEERTRKSPSASLLRSSSKTAPEEVDVLKHEIADLKQQKEGLVLAVRRLLKANQTEAQREMLSALRGAKKQAQEAESRLIDTKAADGARMAKLQKLEKDTEEKLKSKKAEFETLHRNAVDAKKQAETITALHQALEKQAGVKGELSKLQAEAAKLRGQNKDLEEEKRGLESTVQKLWHVNAPAAAKNMLQVVEKQQTQLAAMSEAKLAEEKQFAEERSDLSMTLARYQAENQRLQNANQKLKDETAIHREKLEKMQASKDSDENIFAQQLKDLQKKAESAEALIHKKDEELKDAANRDMKYYSAQWQKTQKKLEAKVAADEKEKEHLQAKLNDLINARKQRDSELSGLHKEKLGLQNDLEKEQGKLTYAVDKENTEMQYVEKLQAEKQKLTAALPAALQKQADLEAQLAQLETRDESLKELNLKLVENEKLEREQLAKMQQDSSTLQQKVLQERKKLDFAVDQENTALMAVKLLQTQNKQLKTSLQDQTALQTKLKQLQSDAAAKDKTIKTLQEQNSNTDTQLTSLEGQVADLKHQNAVLTDQYTSEQSKLAGATNRAVQEDSTESLALKVLQGENRKLKMELQKAAEEEARMAQTAKINQAKASESDALEAEGWTMKRELEELRKKEESLQHKNDELQETVVEVAAKSRQDHMMSELRAVAQLPSSPAQEDEENKSDGLQKASSELSKLEEQLNRKQQLAQEAREAEDDVTYDGSDPE